MTKFHDIIGHCISTAAQAHSGQVDKQGVPYIFHPMRVMDLVRRAGGDEVQQCIAVLHDVVEDAPRYSLDRIYTDLRPYGAQAETIVEGVRLITKVKGEPTDDYVNRMIGTSAQLVKWADSTDNWARLNGLPKADKERLHKRYGANFTLLHETPRQRDLRLAHLSTMVVR